MAEFSPAEIIAHPFRVTRRKGYDTLQVDDYLTRLAEHVARMQAELTRYQKTERAALDVLQHAQRVADETMAAARLDAETLRQNATDGLENARNDAAATLDAARAEADNALLSARVQADAAIERGEAQLLEIEAAGTARTSEFGTLVDELRCSATQSATELRSVGERLVEMAEHFELRLAADGAVVDAHDDKRIDLDEKRVEVT